MSIEKEIKSLLHSIYLRSSSLSEQEQDLLINALENLMRVLDEAKYDRERGFLYADLHRISKYLGRFPSSKLQLDAERSSATELLDIARLRSHSKRKFTKEELRRLQAPFWKELESSAKIWNPDELSNLLSYSLRRNIRIDLDHNADSKAVVRSYHKYFRSLTERVRDDVFEELLQRVLSEPAFRHSLASNQK